MLIISIFVWLTQVDVFAQVAATTAPTNDNTYLKQVLSALGTLHDSDATHFKKIDGCSAEWGTYADDSQVDYSKGEGSKIEKMYSPYFGANFDKKLKELYSKIATNDKSVIIEVEGCTDKKPADLPEADVRSSGPFPPNIVTPIVPGKNPDPKDVLRGKEGDFIKEMQSFLSEFKKKIGGSKLINKEIIVYTTATKPKPTCKSNGFTEQNVSTSFADKSKISNSELAFKRGVVLANILKHYVIAPKLEEWQSAANPPIKEVKIKVKCAIDQDGEHPTYSVHNLLSDQTVPTVQPQYNCGDQINVNGGIGDKPFPSYIKWGSRGGANDSAPLQFYQKMKNNEVLTYVDNSNDYYNRNKKSTLNTSDRQLELVANSPSEKSKVVAIYKERKDCEEAKKTDCDKKFYEQLCKSLKPELLTNHNLYECLGYDFRNYGYQSQHEELPGKFVVTAEGKDYTTKINTSGFKRGQKIKLIFNAFTVPDRFILTVNNSPVIDTGYVSLAYDSKKSDCQKFAQGIVGAENLCIDNGIQPTVGYEHIFVQDISSADVKLFVIAPIPGTVWTAQVLCPDGNNRPSIYSEFESMYPKK